MYIYIFLHTNSPLYPCIWILREQRELHMPARQRELRARAKIVLAELEEALLGVLFGSCVPWVKLQVWNSNVWMGETHGTLDYSWGSFQQIHIVWIDSGSFDFLFPFCLRFVTGLNCMTSLFRLVLESAESPKWNATASLPIDVIWRLQHIHLSCIYACISLGHPEIGLGELREEACASRIGSAARPEAIASRLQRTTWCKRGLPYWHLIPRNQVYDVHWFSLTFTQF